MSKQGEVTIVLEEDTIVLKPTPHALRTVLTECGGAREIFRKIYMLEYDVIFKVMEAGVTASYSKAPDKKNLEENIYKHGIVNLVEPLTDYVNLLINGGKLPEKESSSDTKKK